MKRKKNPLTKTAIKKQLKMLSNKADKIFSLYIRAQAKQLYNDICPLCGKKPIQCCFHFITRKRKSTRWDWNNAVGACHTCNYLENYFSDLSRYWYIKKFGVEQYLSLVEKAKADFTPTKEDLENVIITYSHLLNRLKGVKKRC
jgi:hypothetical protein